MKKVVAVILSLVLLLGLCSVAQAAVQLPTSADKTFIENYDHNLTAANLPVIEKIEQTETELKITFAKDSLLQNEYPQGNISFMTSDGNQGGTVRYDINEDGTVTVPVSSEYPYLAQISCDSFKQLGSSNYLSHTAFYTSDGQLSGYSVRLYLENSTGDESISAEYDGKDQLIYEYYNFYNWVDESSGTYSANYYATSGQLSSYSIKTALEDGASLNASYDQFGRLIWANYYNGIVDCYWENGQWYDYMTGEPAVTAPLDVTTIKAPYAQAYNPTAPAAKLENLDLTKGDLITEEDGYSYYYDGAVNARYDENGNLVHYSYANFDNTQEDVFYVAENGNVTSHATNVVDENGNFYLSSEVYYYANSGMPKSYYYVAENGEYVDCNADGTVASISYTDPVTDYNYYWNPWNGWEVYNNGELVEVDPATLPDPESYKVPALVTVTAITKDDVQVSPNAASAMPELPVAVQDLPSITGVALENGKIAVSVSKDLDGLSINKEDNYQGAYVYVHYALDGEDYWYYSDSDDFAYNADTKTYELDIPEGAEDVYYDLNVYHTFDNVNYYYTITEDGVSIQINNDYHQDTFQSFLYENGKLVSVTTDVGDYSLTSNFDDEGALESYRYRVDQYTNATFLPDGTLDNLRYWDAENEQNVYWDATNGWHTREYADDGETFTATATEKPADAVDPEELKPLIIISKKPEHVWFPYNTLGLAAVSMNDLGISSDWHNVAPIDLTKDGTTVFTLVGADAWILGQAYVTVADGSVTVDYAILDGHGYMKEEKLNWFLSKADLTEENLKAESNYAFGEPVSIADQLGGAETAILFIDSKITFRQPYFDAYNYSTRYYRNRENWKEYREGLIEMIK